MYRKFKTEVPLSGALLLKDAVVSNGLKGAVPGFSIATSASVVTFHSLFMP